MSVLIPGEQRQADLLDGEPLEDVEKYKYLSLMFGANGRATQEIGNRINLARFAFSRLWREISLRTKSRLYQVVVRSILLYGSETWTVRVTDERVLDFFDNDSIRCILNVSRRDCVSTLEMRHRLSLASIPTLLVQRRLH